MQMPGHYPQKAYLNLGGKSHVFCKSTHVYFVMMSPLRNPLELSLGGGGITKSSPYGVLMIYQV